MIKFLLRWGLAPQPPIPFHHYLYSPSQGNTVAWVCFLGLDTFFSLFLCVAFSKFYYLIFLEQISNGFLRRWGDLCIYEYFFILPSELIDWLARSRNLVWKFFSLEIRRNCAVIILWCYWEFWCHFDFCSFVGDLFLFGFRIFSLKGHNQVLGRGFLHSLCWALYGMVRDLHPQAQENSPYCGIANFLPFVFFCALFQEFLFSQKLELLVWYLFS